MVLTSMSLPHTQGFMQLGQRSFVFINWLVLPLGSGRPQGPRRAGVQSRPPARPGPFTLLRAGVLHGHFNWLRRYLSSLVIHPAPPLPLPPSRVGSPGPSIRPELATAVGRAFSALCSERSGTTHTESRGLGWAAGPRSRVRPAVRPAGSVSGWCLETEGRVASSLGRSPPDPAPVYGG